MNNFSIYLLLSLLLLFGVCSCQGWPAGVGEANMNGKKVLILDISNVDLKFDWSKKLYIKSVSADFGEFIPSHNVSDPDWSNYSGTINDLSCILLNVDSYDDSHKPSISVTIEDAYFGKTVHQCNKEDITGNKVFGIPKIDNFYQGTVEIKSIKTRENGVQVVWKKSVLKDSWPINEFVADGTVSCEVTSITKAGTNNDSGNVAARGNTIIPNTSDKPIINESFFIIDEEQIISPDLCKPVLINGSVSKTVKWSEPIICKPNL